jgi:hypothetical protein
MLHYRTNIWNASEGLWAVTIRNLTPHSLLDKVPATVFELIAQVTAATSGERTVATAKRRSWG